MFRSPLRRFALVAGLSLAVSGSALSGPPWIAVEYPVNPHDPATRGAFMTIRTYHHGDLIGYELTGTAEGLVGGRRQSTKLNIQRLSRPGVYAVRWQKPAEGNWVLMITSTRDGNHAASVMVSVDGRGRVASVTVPSDPIENGRWQVPRRVAAAELDALLRAPRM